MAAQPRTAPAPRFYLDHDPAFEWVRGEASDTLLVHLPEYKRQYLKVQVDGHGNLRTGGERPLDGNRWSRFRKDFRLPEDCNKNDIRAKFEDGTLYVHLPKLINPADGAQDRRPAHAAEPKPGRAGHDKSQKVGTGGADGTTKPSGKDADQRVEAEEEEQAGKPQKTGASTDDHHDKRVAAEHGHKVDDGNKMEQSSTQKQKVSEGSNGANGVFQESAARYDMSDSVWELMMKQRQRSMLNLSAAVMGLVGLGVFIYYRN